jgi:hypothetical protein
VLGRLRHGPELVRDEPRGRSEVERHDLHLQLARVEAREVEEIRRQPGQPVDLVPHLGEELLPDGRIHALVVQELDEAAQGEERRPQLVGHVGDELPSRPVEDCEPHAHAV